MHTVADQRPKLTRGEQQRTQKVIAHVAKRLKASDEFHKLLQMVAVRESSLALGSVETYLVEILKLLEAPKMTREEVHALAADTQVLDHVDMLVETLETLRRRLAKLASSLR